jgi:BA14K-like protein
MQRDPEMLRLRTLAAAAILFAGITLGFTLGRMSVWLIATDAPNREPPAREVGERGATVPLAAKTPAGPGAALPAQGAPTPAPTTSAPGPTTSAPTTPQPMMAPKAAASSPTPTSTAPAGPDSAPAASAAGARTQEPPKPVVAPNWRAAAGDPPGSVHGNDEDTRGPNVKLINPSETDLGAAAAEPTKPDADVAEIETDRQGIAACERRYSSFRRSDGTYQPFGGGPRLRCPLLR